VPSKQLLPKQKFSFEAIGTIWEIELFDCKKTNKILSAVKKCIDEFDKNYSRFRHDSMVTKMSQKAGEYALPNDAKPMLDLYYELYKVTDGLMTPLIGQTLSDAGYDADYSFQPKVMRKTPYWEECIEYKFPKLTIKKPVLLDFGAAGKGYLVGIIGVILRAHGCIEFVINAGGDVLHHGVQPVEVALEHPENLDQAIGVAAIKNQALCGSAGNRRSWTGYNHIINPSTLKSPDHLKAVWVCAGSAMLADALTTALYFVDPQELLKSYNFEYAVIRQDLSLGYSGKFPARFFE
jgi:thiamine biosynthesis lipoprotein